MKKLLLSSIILIVLAGCANNQPALESAQAKEKKPDAVLAPSSTVPETAGAPLAMVDAQAMPETETAAHPEEMAGEQPAEQAVQARQEADEAVAIEQAVVARQKAVRSDPLNDTDGALGRRSVFFPFDVDVIQPGDRDTVVAHGEYLAGHPDRKVRVEGHCDERGSTEYNLGLGQRRAENTKRALVLSGASESQIETLSYGEEKPRCTAHEEACWAQNRRADIVYK